MGAATSSNSTDLITNVASSIIQETANANSSSLISNNKIRLNHCDINVGGNLDLNQSANTIQKASQLNKSIQNAAVANNIAQKVAQEAASKVGSLGLGYASANNSVYASVNATSEIKSAISNTLDQFTDTGNVIDCNSSTIDVVKNMSINQGITSKNIANQVLDTDQVAKINNDISQSVKQKATATVEGLAGFLIALALVIASLGYSIAKPLTTGSAKIIIIMVLIVVLFVITLLMYIRKVPPLFQDMPLCASYQDIKTCDEECIDQKIQSVRVKNPPLKYIFSIFDGKDKIDLSRQLVQVYNQNTNQNNAGYNDKIRQLIDQDIQTSIKNIGNVASLSSGVSVPNPLVTSKYLIPEQFMIPSDSSNHQQGLCNPGQVDKIIYYSDCSSLDPSTYKCPSSGSSEISCKYLVSASGDDDPSTVLATYNSDEYDKLSSQNLTTTDWDYIRFVYVDIINRKSNNVFISNHYAINDDDLVQTIETGSNSGVMKLKDAITQSKGYQFIPDSDYKTYYTGSNVSGSIKGMFGYCNSREYKVSKFMRSKGKWILGAILFIVFGFLIFNAYKSKKSENNNGVEKVLTNTVEQKFYFN